MIVLNFKLNSKFLKYMYLLFIMIPIILVLRFIIQFSIDGRLDAFVIAIETTIRLLANVIIFIATCLIALYVIKKQWAAKNKLVRNLLFLCILIYIVQQPVVYGIPTFEKLLEFIPGVSFGVQSYSWVKDFILGLIQPQCLLTVFTGFMLFFVYKKGTLPQDMQEKLQKA